MPKPAGSSNVLFLAPERLYPKFGGGALRTASLFEFLAARHEVDVITFREDREPVTIPGAQDVLVIDLPHHARDRAARAARNLRRCIVGRPPLYDRYSGFDRQIALWLDARSYDLAIIEHFWCASYARVLRPHARRLALDLHNVESALQSTTAATEPWPLSAMYRRFGRAYQHLERRWLPHFDDVLVTSGADANRVSAGRVAVYPNAIPYHDLPLVAPEHAIVFTGNLEYEPNVAAVRWFAHAIWPLVRRAEPTLEWRLVGRNSQRIEPYLWGVEGARIVGEVADAVVEIAHAKVAVVPLLAGSGTRFKIIEAWAASRPVVSTTIGAEGLGAIDNTHLVIADHPEQFASAVLQAIRSPGNLGCNGRDLYLDRYTTEAGWRLLAELGF